MYQQKQNRPLAHTERPPRPDFYASQFSQSVQVSAPTPPVPPPSQQSPQKEPTRTVASSPYEALPFRTPYSSPFGMESRPASVQIPVQEVEQQQAEQTDESFAATTPRTGLLKVETFLANRAVPVEGVSLLISKKIDGKEHIFYNLLTDASGIANDISLPAPDANTSLSPDLPNPYATYLLSYAKRGFLTAAPIEIQIFDGVKTIQPIAMTLDLEGGIFDGVSNS